MYLLNLLSFLVIASSCFAGENRGNVLDFAPPGDFSYIFSKHENEEVLVDKWTEQNGKKIVRINCMKVELNAKSNNVISQLRANILTDDDIELESFKVTECSQSKLLNSIKVSLISKENNKRVYQIIFKDSDKGCRQRDYQVDVPSNKVDSLVAVTREPVVNIKYGYRSKCTIPKDVDGFVVDWYDNGKHHVYDLYKNYDTTLKLGGEKCHECWILCKETSKAEIRERNTNNDNDASQRKKPVQQDQKIFYVDLLLQRTPVDRIKVASCTAFSLRTSITYHLTSQVDDRYKGFYINFLKEDGVCHYRTYNIDVQYHKDIMFKYFFLQREEERKNVDCFTMKARGLARSAVKKVAQHFGRVTSPSVSLQGQDEKDDAN